ncbi:unnamed protein product [Zymoseptoria tritici ST99CH_3D7]|uniref:Secreted protein n=1 Tax=Zymoseptoria tritici (strain ST99CH_3D7) TaxID=1276538 RepID=A0A1X7RQE3_ZYMT9|nr:unnamed protein product [Zymoseptoria tritici ST99CH_3D7]
MVRRAQALLKPLLEFVLQLFFFWFNIATPSAHRQCDVGQHAKLHPKEWHDHTLREHWILPSMPLHTMPTVVTVTSDSLERCSIVHLSRPSVHRSRSCSVSSDISSTYPLDFHHTLVFLTRMMLTFLTEPTPSISRTEFKALLERRHAHERR